MMESTFREKFTFRTNRKYEVGEVFETYHKSPEVLRRAVVLECRPHEEIFEVTAKIMEGH